MTCGLKLAGLLGVASCLPLHDIQPSLLSHRELSVTMITSSGNKLTWHRPLPNITSASSDNDNHRFMCHPSSSVLLVFIHPSI